MLCRETLLQTKSKAEANKSVKIVCPRKRSNFCFLAESVIVPLAAPPATPPASLCGLLLVVILPHLTKWVFWTLRLGNDTERLPGVLKFEKRSRLSVGM